jgi:uncharacterized cupredoxin-like copper-binding protein
MRRYVSRRMLFACSAVIAGACSKAEPPADQAAAVAPVPPPVVHVEAADYSFKAPDTLPSGPTTFHLMNTGKELHHLVLIKATQAEVMKMKPTDPPPAEVVLLGGPNAAVPGGTAEATVDLTPGEYTMVCFIPGPDGKVHMLSGMMRPLVVTQGSNAAAMPTPDITVKLTDYAFEIPDTIAAGRHVIRVEDTGPQLHEMVFVKLDSGKTVQDFAAWAAKMAGPPPVAPVNGVSPMTVGQANTVVVDLTPGQYGLICFIEDAKDKKPHFVHGMIKQITVR